MGVTVLVAGKNAIGMQELMLQNFTPDLKTIVRDCTQRPVDLISQLDLKPSLSDVPERSDSPPLCRPSSIRLVKCNLCPSLHCIEIQILTRVRILQMPRTISPRLDNPKLA